MPVGRRAELAPPPPWLWRRSSVPVRRRSAARCGASQLPEPCGRSAVRVATTNAAAAPVGASRLLLRRVARWTQPSFRNYAWEKRKTARSQTWLSLCGGGGGGDGVEFLCSQETTAQCCDSSFSVRFAQLVASVLVSTMTSHAGLESYQSQTHLPSQRAQHTCDTCLTLHGSGAELRTPSFCAASWIFA